MKNTLVKYLIMGFVFMVSSCSQDDPKPTFNSDDITLVNLIFTSLTTGQVVEVSAEAQNGVFEPGVPAILEPQDEYELFISLKNAETADNISQKIVQNGDNFIFLFEYTSGLFNSPDGTGNTLIRRVPPLINYRDSDSKGRGIGIVTEWITGDPSAGYFRIVLKHQPEIKSTVSAENDGETYLDISWEIIIQNN